MRHWQGRGLLAWALRPLASLYRLLTAFDRWRHRVGLARIERLPVPVLVIGNWISGGAGKTPTLLAVLAVLAGRRERPASPDRRRADHGRHHRPLQLRPLDRRHLPCPL